jgi:hypothetical protein
MTQIPDLSESLASVIDFELSRGNRIERIDRPAGTRCPLAVIFALPLDIEGYRRLHQLPPGVSTWENRDRHYDLEAGYICERSRHAIAGPIP